MVILLLHLITSLTKETICSIHNYTSLKSAAQAQHQTIKSQYSPFYWSREFTQIFCSYVFYWGGGQWRKPLPRDRDLGNIEKIPICIAIF